MQTFEISSHSVTRFRPIWHQFRDSFPDLHDFAFRLAPVSKLAATQMLDELRCAPILRGVRGEQRCFLDGVVDVLLRVSMLVHRYPQIRELDINPLIVNENEVIAVDARVFLG